MGKYGFNLGQRTIITSDPYEEDEYIIYPVLVLISAIGTSHATYTDGQTRTVCGRKINFPKTEEAYRNNTMFLHSLCAKCSVIIHNKKEAGQLG